MKRKIIAAVLLATLPAAGASTVAYGYGQQSGHRTGAEDAQGYGKCPTEDSCHLDYVGGPDRSKRHWVVIPDAD
jgi:hypothetical protein